MENRNDQPDSGRLADRAWQMARGATARLGYVALVDQAVLSGTSFLPHLFLGRFCVKAEYGAYVVAFGAMLLVNRVQAALVSGPLMVLGAQVEEDDFGPYVSALLYAQVVLALAASAVVLAVAAGFSLLGHSPAVVSALFGYGIAGVFMQMREFFRRVLFARLQPGRVLLVDSVYCVGVAGCLACMMALGALNSRNVLLAMGGVGAVGAVAGWVLSRSYFTASLSRLGRTLREQWQFGRWMLMESVASYLHMDLIIFILAAYAGTEAAGRLGASRNVLAPLQVALFGIANVAGPRAAAVFHHGGRGRLNAFLGKVALVSGGVFLAYSVGVAIAPGLPLRALYGDRYVAETLGVRLWAGVYVLMALRQVTSLGLGAMRRPDTMVVASLCSGVLTLGLALWTASEWAVVGALVARMAGELANLLVAGRYLVKPGVERSPVVASGRESSG